MRLVEFIGPPCAGKTTVARALLGLTGQAPGRGPLRWLDARLVVRRPRFAGAPTMFRMLPARIANASIVADLLLGAPREIDIVDAASELAEVWAPVFSRAAQGRGTADGLLGVLARRWAIDALLTRALLERARDTGDATDVAVLDEGVTHPNKVAALAGEDDLAALLEVLPLPDVLVRFHVAEATLVERLTARRAARPDGPRERSWSTPEELGREIARTQGLVEAVVTVAHRRGVAVIDVDGTAEPLDVAGSLAASIARTEPRPESEQDR